jgi:hypothetical protein
MSRRQKSREKPFIIMVFDKYVQSYSINQEGMISTQLKTPSIIQSLTFKSTPIGFLGFGETKWYLTAVHEVVGKDQMNTEAAELYRRLKGMECEVEVKGTIRKEVFFKPHKSLSELKLQIPTLQISNKLCRVLEENNVITDLVKTINPAEMSIELHSIPELMQTSKEKSTQIDPIIEKAVHYFNNPTSITWIATLSTLFQELPFVQRKADSVIQLFNDIFITIRRELYVS